MTRIELETRYTSDRIGSQEYAKLSALVSITEILSSILPLPFRVLDNSTLGENRIIYLLMTHIRTWICGPSVPTFRFTRWCEIQTLIENEYARTPEVLNTPANQWPNINPELCRLLYLQECRAGRHIEGLDYDVDPVTSSLAATLGRKGGKAKTEAKMSAARENGRKGGRPRVEIDWSLE